MRPAQKYVIDASVGVKTAIEEPGSAEARALLGEAARGATRLLAPQLYISEVANVLWKRCRLALDITVEEAADGLTHMLATLPQLVPLTPLADRALQLALTFRRPVYDCFYVALALQENCDLITGDERLMRQLAPALGHILLLQDWVPLPEGRSR